MDETFFWIDDTENLLASPILMETAALEDLLEKIRVGSIVLG